MSQKKTTGILASIILKDPKSSCGVWFTMLDGQLLVKLNGFQWRPIEKLLKSTFSDWFWALKRYCRCWDHKKVNTDRNCIAIREKYSDPNINRKIAILALQNWSKWLFWKCKSIKILNFKNCNFFFLFHQIVKLYNFESVKSTKNW